MQFCFPAPFKPSHRGDTDAESGYVLLAVIFLMVALLIALAIAAPKMAMSIQRDKEMETIHRGEQYRRALQLYYRQYGNYPTSIDQLLNTNNVRFLRKRYTDPMTGKDDWKPILFGQAHVRPLGFFGQPLTGVAGVGTTSASMYAATTSATDANGVPIADNGGNGTTTNGPG
ncbi:MAG TPA: type II secretion system protein, partial [Acidobacteriaceae bacterium]|nr:type II secretion system protein [Acidobacteriaceae bacterium]